MEHYSAIKGNKIGSFVDMCMDLDFLIQSEVREKEKNIMYQYIYVEPKKMIQMNLFSGEE